MVGKEVVVVWGGERWIAHKEEGEAAGRAWWWLTRTERRRLPLAKYTNHKNNIVT